MRLLLFPLTLAALSASSMPALADTASASANRLVPGLYVQPPNVPKPQVPSSNGIKPNYTIVNITGKYVVNATISIVSGIPTNLPIYCGFTVANASKEVVAARVSATSATCSVAVIYDMIDVPKEITYCLPDPLSISYGIVDALIGAGIGNSNLAGVDGFPLFNIYLYAPYTTKPLPLCPSNGTTTTTDIAVEI